MEIRANYVLVGMFALAALAGILTFTLWIGSRDKGVQLDEYEISFNESVKGLSVNSDVLFIGIRVGKVTAIKISDITPGEVRVRIAIAADTPVRRNSTAQLEARGITGVSVISISGGTADSPLIDPGEGAVAEIPTAQSALSSVFSQMPDVMHAAVTVLDNINKVFSPENIEAWSDISTSLRTVSVTVGNRAKSIDEIIARSETLLQDLDALTVNVNKVLETDVKQTSQAMSRIAKRVDDTLTVMDPGLRQFSSTGLADMRMLMVEMRNLTHVMTRVFQKMDSDPRRFFFGDQTQEYQSR
ncbi:MlaD family protein [Desulfovibrio sp. OttesenSCG-928-F20]|nr:MlaD family protein [Desulfovibrio sp. OttesenSCG-928-F20]